MVNYDFFPWTNKNQRVKHGTRIERMELISTDFLIRIFICSNQFYHLKLDVLKNLWHQAKILPVRYQYPISKIQFPATNLELIASTV